MPYKKKILRQLTTVVWGIVLVIIAMYFFLLVPDHFVGWKDYLSYHFFFFLVFITTERGLLPWVTDRLYRGCWVCIYPFLLQFVLVFLLVLLFSLFVGGLKIDEGWHIINLWQAIIPLLLLPNTLAVLLFVSRKGLRSWTDSEKYQLQLLNQELNPHLLNNNLVKLRPLILLNQKRAVRFVQLNNPMFHYYLTHRKEMTIPIQEELEQVKIRLEMQEIKKMSAVALKTEVDARVLHESIPTMMLVNLIGNCFSYGVLFDQDRPIWLEIELLDEEKIRVRVSNYVDDSESVKHIGTGTSLSRMADLLRLLDPDSKMYIGRDEELFVVTVVYRVSI